MMNKEYKKKLFNNTFKRVLLHYFVNGAKSTIHSIPKAISVIMLFGMFSVAILITEKYFRVKTILPVLDMIARISNIFILSVLVLLLLTVLMILFGKPKNAHRYHNDFQRCGMVNSSGESPALIKTTQTKTNSRIKKYVFFSKGLPLSLWNDKKEEIESALNLSIDSIEQGKNKQHFVVNAVDGDCVLPNKIDWDSSYINPKESILVLGESIARKVEVDLSNTPHMLIAGSSGSGKSVLGKLLLMQCALKKYDVYIADFKGGVDFNKSWKRHAHIVTEPEDLLTILNYIIEELHRRKRLFADLDCSNIDEYNKRFGEHIHRIVFGCDEVAELLDKTGLDKKEKNTIALYEASIATIARLGRAFGIHLILATQRPDANIISGQIKNNIDFRACGRADNILSQIILDKGDANDLISKSARGRFLTNSDVLFQAYYFDDSKGW